jgi:hypothetical protein
MLLATASPSRAARPLLDQHQWDAYFALFARDVSVPWKPSTVRLDTYSGAPVDFAAYYVDPADVIVAGQNRAPRALDTSGRTPIARWRFTPPPGYRFESSDVDVPLGNREGFFVIEARRGDALQQVWLNRTHIGLVTLESPEGLALWAADLQSGKPLANTAIAFLVGLQLITKRTDASGLVVWRDPRRPSFALAENGAGRAFVSLLPQAPLPATLVGMRLDAAVVRAGERVRFVGFVRKRTASGYRNAAGDVKITLAGHGRTLVAMAAHLDAAGAFGGELIVPPESDAGDYALLASASGGVGGTSVHVDAASDLQLTIRTNCPCDPAAPLVLTLVARRAGLPAAEVPMSVRVVRSPHTLAPGAPEDEPLWGTTLVADAQLRSDAQGRALLTIPQPSDGLDSTYGVEAIARGATASARVAVPQGRIALSLEPDAPSADVGVPAGFSVRAFTPVDGAPVPGLDVTLRLAHGATFQEQNVKLDARGRGRAVFHETSLGSNLALASADAGGRQVLDAASVLVEPSALSGSTASDAAAATVALDKERYRPGESLGVHATAPGAAGSALLALTGARTYQTRLAGVSGGVANGSVDLGDAQGDVRVSAAFVRDGAIALGSAPVAIDGPGHPRALQLAFDKAAYGPGETVRATVRDGIPGEATIVLRVADGPESGSAYFDDAPALLSTGGTTSQNPASDSPAWHAYVVPAHSKANDIFAAENPRKVPTEPPSLGAASPRTLLWRMARGDGANVSLAAPLERGHYVLSLLELADDGDVGAVSAGFTVQ